jgi:hypothetical protein
MRLVSVDPEELATVTGFERHTIECSSCHEVEHRLIFTHEPTPQPVLPSPIDAAPTVPRDPVNRNEAAPSVPPIASEPNEDGLPTTAASNHNGAGPPVSPLASGSNEVAVPTSTAFVDQNEPATPSRWMSVIAKLRRRRQ